MLKSWRHPCKSSDWDKVDDIPVRRVTEVEDAGALNWNWVKWLGDASLCTTLNTGVTLLDKKRNASFGVSGQLYSVRLMVRYPSLVVFW